MKLYLWLLASACIACQHPAPPVSPQEPRLVDKVADHIRLSNLGVVVVLSGGCTYNEAIVCDSVKTPNNRADLASLRENAKALANRLRELHIKTSTTEHIYTKDAYQKIVATYSDPKGQSIILVLMDLPRVHGDTTKVQLTEVKITGSCKTCSATMYVYEFKWKTGSAGYSTRTVVNELHFQLEHPFARRPP